MKRILIFYALLVWGAWLPLYAQSVWTGTRADSFASGTGSKEDPYLINESSQLAFLADEVNSGADYSGLYIRLEKDLDMGLVPWTPIGDGGSLFNGYFDGNGKTLSRLIVDRTDASNNGLFGELGSSATVKGLHLDTSCKISVTVSSSFSGSVFAGAIAGVSHGSIYQCSNSAPVKVSAEGNSEGFGISYYSGGLVGQSYGSLEECYNRGKISCIQPENIYNSTTYAGGITGAQFNTPIRSCYNAGDVVSQPAYAGGIAGQGTTRITNSYNIGVISSSWNISGGISGIPGSDFSYTYCLESSATNGGGGLIKSEEEMKSVWFVDSLNMGLANAAWLSDISSQNNGFPVLAWQNSSGVQIDVETSVNGTFDVYLGNKILALPASVTPGSEIRLVARPETDYILESFLKDSEPIVGNTLTVFSSCTLGAEFSYCQDVQLWDGSVSDSYSGGSGTEDDPYLISSPSELALLARETNSGRIDEVRYFKLMKNLDLNQIEWIPIGNKVEHPFMCHFDGNHKVIANLLVTNDTNDYYGLFGYVNPIEISDLGIVGASYVKVAEGSGGSIAGTSYATIRNCFSDCQVAADFYLNNSYSGGICGKNGGEIFNCYQTGSVLAENDAVAGGIVADNLPQGRIGSCYVVGKVSADMDIFSGAGCVYNQGNVEHCYFLEGSCSNPGSAILKTNEEMMHPSFPDSLNRSQVSLPWMEDTISLNGGFPILKWQAGDIFPVFIQQPEHGRIQVFALDKEIQNGDKVAWEQEISFTEEPGQDYIIDYFTVDSRKIYGKITNVYDVIDISASFASCSGVKSWDGSVAEGFSAGSGTLADPYLIQTPSELAFLAESNNDGQDYENVFFELANNLDMRSLEWIPIGSSVENAFKGTFNGNGKIIANLNVNAPYAGLFGVVTQHCLGIERLGIAGVSTITSSDAGDDMESAGSIVGRSFAPVKDCFTRNACIFSTEAAGGIVGSNMGNVSNCYNASYVCSEAFSGGIVGANSDTVSYCYNRGFVETRNRFSPWANGIAGSSFEPGYIHTCFNVIGGSEFNQDGAEEKSDSEMMTDEFASELNYSQLVKHWATDLEKPINDGFLILKWQDPRAFSISTSLVGNGTITPTSYVSYGDTFTVEIQPSDNHIITDVVVDGISVGPRFEYTFENITGNHTVIAYIEVVKYSIKVSFGPNGTISPDTAVVPHGEHITFDIIPDEGYMVTDVVVDGVSVGKVDSYTFTSVTADHTLHADFSIATTVTDNFIDEIEVYQDKNMVYIRTGHPLYAVNLYSLTGRRILGYTSISGDFSLSIPSPGFYLIEIVCNGKKMIKKVSVIF